MEKLKYLVIFSLCVVCGILYYQYETYKQISKVLVVENNTLDKKLQTSHKTNEQHKEKISNLQNKIDEQNQKIFSLEEDIAHMFIKSRVDTTVLQHDNNSSQTFQEAIEPIDNIQTIEEEKSMFDLPVEPKVTMDKDNNIQSIELQIEKSF